MGRTRRDALKLYFDGGCRPNPGPMETAVVVRGQMHHRAGIGDGDNNDAEWLALIDALQIAQSLGANDVVLLGDSAPVIAQASGTAPCRNDRFREYRARFLAMAAGFARVRVRHVARSHNLAGIALERIHGKL